jgi:rfaE bifunctional protein nucleotidyltransferase chain/domain
MYKIDNIGNGNKRIGEIFVMKKIWVNGTFDVLHIGHIRLILHAASLGILRVGIDTDERVRSKKGIERPFNKLEDRMEFLSAISGVDSVVSFGTDDELRNCIKEWNADIMVIGGEYKYKEIIGLEHVPHIEFFEKIEGFSTTNILKNKK